MSNADQPEGRSPSAKGPVPTVTLRDPTFFHVEEDGHGGHDLHITWCIDDERGKGRRVTLCWSDDEGLHAFTTDDHPTEDATSYECGALLIKHVPARTREECMGQASPDASQTKDSEGPNYRDLLDRLVSFIRADQCSPGATRGKQSFCLCCGDYLSVADSIARQAGLPDGWHCEDCDGDGVVGRELQRCRRCKGTGRKRHCTCGFAEGDGNAAPVLDVRCPTHGERTSESKNKDDSVSRADQVTDKSLDGALATRIAEAGLRFQAAHRRDGGYDYDGLAELFALLDEWRDR